MHAELINNEAEHRFEMNIGGQIAFVDYNKIGDTYLLIHTEVPESLRGQGAAAALIEKVFAYLEENHFKMRPFCAYIQAYLKTHPDWKRLIDK